MDDAHQTPPHGSHGRHSRVARVAAGVILALALVRAMAVQSPLPYWDTDPLTVYTPIAGESGTGLLSVLQASLLGLTPTWSILLDALTLLAAGVAMWAAPRTDGRARMIVSGLALLGSIGVAIHATRHGGMSLEHARIGISWLAAIWGAIGLWCVCADRRARALLAGVLLAFIIVLAAKGLIQILIEHPRTVASFEADKRAFFESKGWAPESSNAQAYERRLRQREATGWFGLANVLASFAGAALVALAMMLARLPRQARTDKHAWPLIALAIAALATLVMSGSKGGVGAAGLAGVVVLVLLWLLPKRCPSAKPTPRWLGLGACAAIAITILAIALRGLLGERLGELSTLFRWFYMQGATRIFAAEPLTGVGPAGFQSAYSLQKPAISPEDVTSPHSIAFDYLATLGLFGFALIALFLLAVWRLGATLAYASDSNTLDRPPITRHRLYAVAAIAASAFFLALWLERGASMPLVLASALTPVEPVSMVAILVGLILTLGLCALWILLAERLWAMFESQRAALSAVAAGALTIAIHAQIEMTPIQPSSAALLGVWLAIAAGTGRDATQAAPVNDSPETSLTVGQVNSLARWTGVLPLVLGVLTLTAALPSVVAWESRLANAARIAAPVGEARTELRALVRFPPAQRRPAMAALADRVSQDLSEPVAPTPSAIADALSNIALTRGEQTEELLDTAHDALGGVHPPTLRAQTRLLRRLASEMDDPATSHALLTRALSRADRLAGEQPDLAGSWSLLGLVHSELATFSDQRQNLLRAREAWEREMQLDPHSLGTAIRLMEVSEQLDDRPSAAVWATRALAISQNMRLDPLRQLDERTRARAERIARNP